MKNKINAKHIIVRKHKPAIDHNNIVSETNYCHILANFPQAAQGNNLQFLFGQKKIHLLFYKWIHAVHHEKSNKAAVPSSLFHYNGILPLIQLWRQKCPDRKSQDIFVTFFKGCAADRFYQLSLQSTYIANNQPHAKECRRKPEHRSPLDDAAAANPNSLPQQPGCF